jgi:hypothetical protein
MYCGKFYSKKVNISFVYCCILLNYNKKIYKIMGQQVYSIETFKGLYDRMVNSQFHKDMHIDQ